MNAWTCPGCGDTYAASHECQTCHTREIPWLAPVPIVVDGVEYLVKRQLRGSTTVMTANGHTVRQPERGNVLTAFLAQQHS